MGSCPHWSGSVSGELRKDLAASGRARLYGILFDTDSARIRPESLATLDEVTKMLTAESAWQILIEGHTDASGAALAGARVVVEGAGFTSRGEITSVVDLLGDGRAIVLGHTDEETTQVYLRDRLPMVSEVRLALPK